MSGVYMCMYAEKVCVQGSERERGEYITRGEVLIEIGTKVNWS